MKWSKGKSLANDGIDVEDTEVNGVAYDDEAIGKIEAELAKETDPAKISELKQPLAAYKLDRQASVAMAAYMLRLRNQAILRLLRALVQPLMHILRILLSHMTKELRNLHLRKKKKRKKDLDVAKAVLLKSHPEVERKLLEDLKAEVVRNPVDQVDLQEDEHPLILQKKKNVQLRNRKHNVNVQKKQLKRKKKQQLRNS